MSEYNRRLNSRLNRPNRKKKTNTILNVLIGIVLLLIIVVVVNIVTNDEPKTPKEENDAAISGEETTKDSEKPSVEDKEKGTDAVENQVEQEKSDTNGQGTEQQEVDKADEEKNVTVESSTEPNVETVIVDPTWVPIGTTQTGEHISSYDSQSVDYLEKIQALSYGTGLEPSNMYVKRLANGGSPQKSVGTVTSKDGKEIYRIYLEWVDGQGWKPTKKEKLTSLEDAS